MRYFPTAASSSNGRKNEPISIITSEIRKTRSGTAFQAVIVERRARQTDHHGQGWSGRSTARAAVGGEFPARTLSVVRRVPSSAIAHVSASPLCHPGRSDFPSPVGDHDFPPTAFPYPTRLKRSLAFTPLGSGLPPVSTKLALSPLTQVLSPVRWARPCPPWPRVPSPSPGITLPGAASRRLGPALPDRPCSYGLMRQTWMLRGPSLSLGATVLAGCCEPLLQTGPSRHYLCNPCPGAWTPTRW